MSTSNYELIEICKKVNLPLIFCGTKDQIPKELKNGCYIINLQDLFNEETGERNDGTHWTGLYVNNNKAYYFDSFGFPSPNIVIQRLKKQKIVCQYNLKEIQNINSSTCGKYVIAFLIYVSKKQYPFEKFIQTFSDTPEKNNQILENILDDFSINLY